MEMPAPGSEVSAWEGVWSEVGSRNGLRLPGRYHASSLGCGPGPGLETNPGSGSFTGSGRAQDRS